MTESPTCRPERCPARLTFVLLAVLATACGEGTTGEDTGQGATAARASHGLRGTYFDSPNLGGPSVVRTDATVDFDWQDAAPIDGISPHRFSVRWTGQIDVSTSETYTFFVHANDGVRLWVDGKPIVSTWKAQAAANRSGSVTLSAGRRYDIELEYYDGTGPSVVRLEYASPKTTRRVVPATDLVPISSQGQGAGGQPSGAAGVGGSSSVAGGAAGQAGAAGGTPGAGAEGAGGAGAGAAGGQSAGGGAHAPIVGVRDGNGATVDQFGTWLGGSATYVRYAIEYEWTTSWGGVEGPPSLLGPWSAWKKESAGRRLVLATGMGAAASGVSPDMAGCAAHHYDENWKALAHNLIAAGLDDTILRVAHEFNGRWAAYNSGSEAAKTAQWVGCWKNIVTAVRSVAGARFEFCWNVAIGTSTDPTTGENVFPESAWPGAEYVDYLGIDTYDEYGVGYEVGKGPPESVQEAKWRATLTVERGLNWWADFAAKNGHVPLAFPEWGLVTKSDRTDCSGGPTDVPGGGDDPYYVEQMHAWMSAHDVAFQAYFDVNACDGNHSLSAFPKGQAAFKKAFGP